MSDISEMIDAVKGRLLEYLETVAEPRGGGKYTCPICGSGERPGGTAALQYYPETRSFSCFSCGSGGSVIDLYMKQHEIQNTKANAVKAAKTLAGMFGIPIPEGKPKASRTVVNYRKHVYHNPDGSIFACKTVRKFDDGNKDAIWNLYDPAAQSYHLKAGLQGKHAPLYDVHLLLGAAFNPIFIVEGEKDAETLKQWGLLATSAPNGARSNWRVEYNKPLEGHDIVILADNDKDGREGARKAARGVYDCARSVKLIQATDIYEQCPEKGDISDISSIIGAEQAKSALWSAVEAAAPFNPAAADPESDGQAEAADPLADFKSALDFTPEPVNWLWSGRIPAGYITFLMSPGGSGKSFLSATIAAAVSTGSALPFGQPAEPAHVLFLSAEDAGAVIRERLERCGADLNRITIQDIDAERPLMFPDNVEDESSMSRWNAVLSHYRPRLVVCDVWHAFCNDKIDLNKQNAVRAVLRSVARLAKIYDCAFLLLAHTNKRRQETNLNDALLGSSDAVNAARSVLCVVTDSDSEEKALVHSKSNLSGLAPSIAFRVDGGFLNFNGVSGITKALCEEAARKRCTPWELLELKERNHESDTELLATLAGLAKVGQILKISYDEVEEAGGAHIWGGGQPKRALDRLKKADLLSRGLSIETGKRVKTKDGQTKNGFYLSCNVTSEEIAGALPK